MSLLDTLIRPSIISMAGYSSARSEFSSEPKIALDANENSLGAPTLAKGVEALNRYPDPKATALRSLIATLKGVDASQVFLGNGSDEPIDLLIRAVCEPKQDEILVLEPSYSMYEIQAAIHSVGVIKVKLTPSFELDADAVLTAVTANTKIIFLCSPNNPTGNALGRDAIRKVLERFKGLLVVDEAYIDFCDDLSWRAEVKNSENLVVSQTLSKAWGMAAVRLGIAIANPKLVAVLDKIKYPYNLSTLAQAVAAEGIKNRDFLTRSVATLIGERERVRKSLGASPEVLNVYPSDANFLLVKFKDAKRAYRLLVDRGIVVRDRSHIAGCENCLRITIGTKLENDELLGALGISLPDKVPNGRAAHLRRTTKETDIFIELGLDGKGDVTISTGLGFFDHMLQQLAFHSGCDLQLVAHGDLEIDPHHTIEDTGLALGDAYRRALGDKHGIGRYGFVLPMDEAVAQVSIDLSGRPFLVWEVPFSNQQLGEVPTELFSHFFQSFSQALGCALNVDAKGKNDHHIIESIFKGVGRALRQATEVGKSSALPTTKGVL